MPEMSRQDIEQKFYDSVLMYEKRPVLFRRMAADKSCRIFDLLEQKEEQVEFDFKKFLPPAPRIGFINIGGSVLYAARLAIRRYKVGLSTENLSIHTLKVRYPDGDAAHYVKKIKSLERKELGEALLRKYPTLSQAVRKVSQFEGACAFDKQFCIDQSHNIFYKTDKVGKYNSGDIVFDEGYKHLDILLEKRFEISF